MKINENEAFLIIRKWHVEQTPVVFVGSLMPNHVLRGRVVVVIREGIWNRPEKPDAIWGFDLKGENIFFEASNFEDFGRFHFAELPADVRKSLPVTVQEHPVLALTVAMKLRPGMGVPLTTVKETFYLVEE